MSVQLTRDEVREAYKSFFALRQRGLTQHQAPGFRRKGDLSLLKYVQSGFKVEGDRVVPSLSTGRANGVRQVSLAEKGSGGGANGAFKVATLRNVTLTAPYMRNGAFATLEEVLDFYAGGGGRGRGLDVPLQDDKIRKFPLTVAAARKPPPSGAGRKGGFHPSMAPTELSGVH